MNYLTIKQIHDVLVTMSFVDIFIFLKGLLDGKGNRCQLKDVNCNKVNNKFFLSLSKVCPSLICSGAYMSRGYLSREFMS